MISQVGVDSNKTKGVVFDLAVFGACSARGELLRAGDPRQEQLVQTNKALPGPTRIAGSLK